MSSCMSVASALGGERARTLEELQARLKIALPRAAVALHSEGEDGTALYLCRSELELVAILHYLPRLKSWRVDGWSVDGYIIPSTGPQGEAVGDAWGRLVATWRKGLGRSLVEDLGGERGL